MNKDSETTNNSKPMAYDTLLGVVINIKRKAIAIFDIMRADSLLLITFKDDKYIKTELNCIKEDYENLV